MRYLSIVPWSSWWASPCASEGTVVVIPNTSPWNRQGVQGDNTFSWATPNDPFKDFKQLQEERNFIQSCGLEGVGRAFFWKRRWKVDGSICAPICWAVLVENLSEHCRCPFTMSASTPWEQGPQGSLLGAAPLFQDPKYLQRTVTCFKLTDSLLSDRSLRQNSQFWLFFRALAMCSAHLINGCSLSYWWLTLLLATPNQEGKRQDRPA